jgi:hypothetical protein
MVEESLQTLDQSHLNVLRRFLHLSILFEKEEKFREIR